MDLHTDNPQYEFENTQLDSYRGDESLLGGTAVTRSKLMMPQEYDAGQVKDVLSVEVSEIEDESSSTIQEKPVIGNSKASSPGEVSRSPDEPMLDQTQKVTDEYHQGQPHDSSEELDVRSADLAHHSDSVRSPLEENAPSISVQATQFVDSTCSKPPTLASAPADLSTSQPQDHPLIQSVEESPRPDHRQPDPTVQSEKETGAQEHLPTFQDENSDASVDPRHVLETAHKPPPDPSPAEQSSPRVEAKLDIPTHLGRHLDSQSELHTKPFIVPSPTGKSDTPLVAEADCLGGLGADPADGVQGTDEAAKQCKQAPNKFKEESTTKVAHRLTPGINHGQAMLRNMPPFVLDLIHWRDLKKSGIVFGAGFLILLSLVYFSVISVFAYVLLSTVATCAIIRVGGFARHTLQHGPEGHPLKEYIQQDLSLSEDKVQDAAQLTVKKVNCYINYLRDLLLVESYINSLKFTLLLWIITYIGKWFNGLTLIILCYVGLFTLPKVYEMNKALIDGYVDIVSSRVSELKAKIVSAIPMGHKQAAASSEDDKKSQ